MTPGDFVAVYGEYGVPGPFSVYEGSESCVCILGGCLLFSSLVLGFHGQYVETQPSTGVCLRGVRIMSLLLQLSLLCF